MNKDARLGKHGEFAPSVCAVTGQKMHRDKPHSTYNIGGGYYFQVLAKAIMLLDKEAVVDELKKSLSSLSGSQPKVVSKSKGKS